MLYSWYDIQTWTPKTYAALSGQEVDFQASLCKLKKAQSHKIVWRFYGYTLKSNPQQ